MKKTLAILLVLSLMSALAACGKPAAVPNTALVLGEKFLFDLDYEQSLLQFDQALTIEPKNPRAWLGKYAAQELMGNHDEAVQTLREAKKKAGGAEIKAALKAAVISAEEGLLAAAEAYKGLGFREIALLLLKLCVEVYHEAERFAAALTALEQEPVTGQYNGTSTAATEPALKEIKLEQYLVPFTKTWVADSSSHNPEYTGYWDFSAPGALVTGGDWYKVDLETLANALGCTKRSSESLYGGVGGDYYRGDGVEVVDALGISVAWTSPNISVYGLKVGDTIAQANAVAQEVFGHDFVKYDFPEFVDDFPYNYHDTGAEIQVDEEEWIWMNPIIGVTFDDMKVTCIYVIQEFAGIAYSYFGF